MGGDWCLAAGKVTVGLASHWPHVTDISGSPLTGLKAWKTEMSTPYTLLWSMADFTFTLYQQQWCAMDRHYHYYHHLHRHHHHYYIITIFIHFSRACPGQVRFSKQKEMGTENCCIRTLLQLIKHYCLHQQWAGWRKNKTLSLTCSIQIVPTIMLWTQQFTYCHE